MRPLRSRVAKPPAKPACEDFQRFPTAWRGASHAQESETRYCGRRSKPAAQRTARQNCRRLVQSPCGRRSWGSRRTVHWRRDFSGRGFRPPSRPPDLPGIRRRPGLALARRFYDGDLRRFVRRGLKGPIVLKLDSARFGRICPEGRGAAGSAAGASTFPISGAGDAARRGSPPNVECASFVCTPPGFTPIAVRFCCRRISTVNEGGARFKKALNIPRRMSRAIQPALGQCAVDVDEGKPNNRAIIGL